MKIDVVSLLAPSDYTAQSGSVTVTDGAQLQCIPISIVSSSSTEQDVECFTFSTSAADTVTGLTVDPAQASVCIIDRNGEQCTTWMHITYKIMSAYV